MEHDGCFNVCVWGGGRLNVGVCNNWVWCWKATAFTFLVGSQFDASLCLTLAACMLPGTGQVVTDGGTVEQGVEYVLTALFSHTAKGV